MSVHFPGADTSGPPDFVTTGTDSWADFVESELSGNRLGGGAPPAGEPQQAR